MSEEPLRQSQVRTFDKELKQWDTKHERCSKSRQSTIETLTSLADELDEVLKKVRTIKVVGSMMGIAAAGLTVFGVFSVRPLGFDLIVAGTAVSVASGVTIFGSTIGDIVHTRKTKQAVDKALLNDNLAAMMYQEAREGLQVAIHVAESIRCLAPIGGITTTAVLADVMVGTTSSIIARSVAAFQNAIPVVGPFITLITLPIDFVTMVSNYVDIAKDTRQKLSTEWRTLAGQLTEELEKLRSEHDHTKHVLLSGVRPGLDAGPAL